MDSTTGMIVDGSVLGEAGIVPAAPTQLQASTTALVNSIARRNGNNTMQQAQVTAQMTSAAAQQPQAAVAPLAPMAGGRISSRAVTAVAGASAAAAEPIGNGMTRVERETALYMLNLLAKYKEADPFRDPVDYVAMVRAPA
jgi:hypothetical protein